MTTRKKNYFFNNIKMGTTPGKKKSIVTVSWMPGLIPAVTQYMKQNNIQSMSQASEKIIMDALKIKKTAKTDRNYKKKQVDNYFDRDYAALDKYFSKGDYFSDDYEYLFYYSSKQIRDSIWHVTDGGIDISEIKIGRYLSKKRYRKRKNQKGTYVYLVVDNDKKNKGHKREYAMNLPEIVCKKCGSIRQDHHLEYLPSNRGLKVTCLDCESFIKFQKYDDLYFKKTMQEVAVIMEKKRATGDFVIDTDKLANCYLAIIKEALIGRVKQEYPEFTYTIQR